MNETAVSRTSRHRLLSVLARGMALGVAGALVLGACQAAAPPAQTGAPVVTRLSVHADTVQGPKNLLDDERAASVCVQKNRYAHNEEIVWRVKVIDPLTNEPLGEEQLSSVVVKLPDQELPLRWGPHPRDNPLEFFWTVAWLIPEDYPSGQLPYTVEATAKDGRSGAFEEFKVAAARLAVTDQVRPPIAPTPSP